jgi:hypothetical protein
MSQTSTLTLQLDDPPGMASFPAVIDLVLCAEPPLHSTGGAASTFKADSDGIAPRMRHMMTRPAGDHCLPCASVYAIRRPVRGGARRGDRW